MIVPVILCGGSGTRLWPLSRQQYPKQFLPLIDKHTLLQNTVKRLDGIDSLANPVVLCHENHRFIVADQLHQIDCRPEALILEPIGRNTAPAVAIAALHTLAQDRNPILLVLPADHHINDIKRFHQSVALGTHLAQEGYLVTFGIVPTSPETGYGYIQKGAALDVLAGNKECGFAIARFVEKPDRDTAQNYVNSGEYCWNSGMFMFSARQVLAEMEKSAPTIVAACRTTYANSAMDPDFLRLNHDEFSACPSDSIDYAVMEHTQKGAMLPLSAGWNDLGSWPALWQEGVKDDKGNVFHGDIIAHDVHDSYLHASHRLLTAVGLDRHIVVETADAVFVAPHNRGQDVKQIVAQLDLAHRNETRSRSQSHHPWGTSETIAKTDRYQISRMTLNPGADIPEQRHLHGVTHWVVVHGTAQVVQNNQKTILKTCEAIHIGPNVTPCLKNPDQTPLELIEVQMKAPNPIQAEPQP